MRKISTNVDGVKEAILFVKNNTEKVYFFNSGDKADLVGEPLPYSPAQFNVFGIYNSSILNLYKSVLSVLKEECLNKEISFNGSEYYVSSDYFKELVNTQALYDFGGIGIPCFNGMISLQEKEIVVYLNDKEEKLNCGDMLFFEAGQEIRYKEKEVECIYFNVAPRFMIENQYPFKWIPVGA
jgi:hypothetical protein